MYAALWTRFGIPGHLAGEQDSVWLRRLAAIEQASGEEGDV